MVHRQKDAQPREGRQSGRRDGHGVPDSAAALPAPEIVVGDGQHGGQQAQLLVFQLAPPVRAPNVRRQGLHLGALAGGVRFEADELGEAFVRLPLHQDGQHMAAALPFDEVFQLPHAPAAFQIPGGADGDEPLAAVQGSFDIRPQIGGQGQLFLVPKHPAHALFAGLGPYAGGHAVGFDGAVQGLGHLHVRALVPIADEGAVPLGFHYYFLSFGQKRGDRGDTVYLLYIIPERALKSRCWGILRKGRYFLRNGLTDGSVLDNISYISREERSHDDEQSEPGFRVYQRLVVQPSLCCARTWIVSRVPKRKPRPTRAGLF